MVWTWDYVRSDGTAVEGLAVLDDGTDPHEVSFASQAEAETWFGESWRALLEQGVDAVNLRSDGVLVYGPMSLHPA